MFLKVKMRFILHCATSLDWGFPKKITSPQPQTFWPVILGMTQPLGITLHIKSTLYKSSNSLLLEIHFLEGTKEKKKLKKFPRKKQSQGRQCVDGVCKKQRWTQEIRCFKGIKKEIV
jgi:hypothetical protein